MQESENQKSFSNDYNYPTLSRKDLMSLSTITPNDYPKHNLKGLTTKRNWSTNLYNLDIEKSYPNRFGIYTHKISYINKNDDIPKSQPSKEKISQHPYFILNCRDIEKAYPSINKPSQRHTNPLEPIYTLPKPPTPLPFPTPKFIRDQIDISDIKGTKSSSIYQKLRSKPSEYYYDIPFTHPKIPYKRKVFYDSLNYNDVTGRKEKKNSLNSLNVENVYSPAEGRALYRFNRRSSSLSTNDIFGCNPGSKNKYNLYNCDRKKLYSSLDIEGAQANTKKKGIITKRSTNPLNPKYIYLGNSENINESGNAIQGEKIRKGYNDRYEAFNRRNIEIVNEKIVSGKRNGFRSQSYGNIFIGSNKKDNAKESMEVNDVKAEEEWNKIKAYEDKPVFDKELYKKPKPNFGFWHDKALWVGIPNRNNRRDVQKQMVQLVPSNMNDNNIKRFDRIGVNKSVDAVNCMIKEDPLYYKLNSPPCYEKQLDYFIKDNDYCLN